MEGLTATAKESSDLKAAASESSDLETAAAEPSKDSLTFIRVDDEKREEKSIFGFSSFF